MYKQKFAYSLLTIKYKGLKISIPHHIYAPTSKNIIQPVYSDTKNPKSKLPQISARQ